MSFPKSPGPPEWVASDATPIRGLDLLGLRIPVERIGQTLLEAVTTITPTIRYISLRAWIARRYALARLPDDWKSFRAFAGRIEAAVALGNLLVDRNTGGLVGPDEGQIRIDAGNGPLTLEPLVKQLAVSAYAGPSDALHVSFSDPDMEIPGLTRERGLALADGVQELVKDTRFAKTIVADPAASVFSRDVLREFGTAFPIGRPEGREREVLISCLFPNKEAVAAGPFMTYRLLLQLAENTKRRPKAEDVFEAAVRPDQMPAAENFRACLNRWLWYLVRDMIAACHEAALQAVVDALSRADSQVQRSDLVLQSLLGQDSTLEMPLRDLGVLPTGRPPLDRSLAALAELVRKATTPKPGTPSRWASNLQETAVIRSALSAGAGSIAVLPLAWLMVRERIGTLSDIPADIQQLLSYQGRWRIGIAEVILPELEEMLSRNVSIRNAAHELTVRTVNHHLNVAWGRLHSDPRRDVSVISADGDRWSQHNGFKAGRTASRLSQAIGWLQQMGLIDDNGCTTGGRKILNEAWPHAVGAVAQ